MWSYINDNDGLQMFMHDFSYFHDSCIKEMHYVSGAYVDDELAMHPINDQRSLRVIIQRQSRNMPVVELLFEGLKYLKLFPLDPAYTCEILDSTMILRSDRIYWCDMGGLSEADLDGYNGTVICASRLRWRPVNRSEDGSLSCRI